MAAIVGAVMVLSVNLLPPAFLLFNKYFNSLREDVKATLYRQLDCGSSKIKILSSFCKMEVCS